MIISSVYTLQLACSHFLPLKSSSSDPVTLVAGNLIGWLLIEETKTGLQPNLLFACGSGYAIPNAQPLWIQFTYEQQQTTNENLIKKKLKIKLYTHTRDIAA